MPTITYGKGKYLRPTPVAALKETIAQNARDGKVELLDLPAKRQVKATVQAGVQVQSKHAVARVANGLLTPVRQGGEPPARRKPAVENQRGEAAPDTSKEVRVRIHAPQLVDFFKSIERDELLVMRDDRLVE